MTREEHQAQLLDDYLSALQQDSHAQIPEGLDPEMAEFARMMIGDRYNQAESSMAESRVWEQVREAPPQSQTENQDMEPYMKKRIEKQKRSRKRRHWLPLASVAIFTIIIGLGLAIMMLRDDNQLLASQDIQQTATQLIMDATSTAISTATPSPTSDPFGLTATALIQDVRATQLPPTNPQVITSTPLPTMTRDANHTSGTIISATQTTDARLDCVFEGELIFRLSQNLVHTNETLRISGAALNPNTEQIRIEIFGGFLTEDAFQPIVEISGAFPRVERFLAEINGTDYEAGSYLIQFSLIDDQGETLSSCGLPVTLTGDEREQ